MNIDRRKEILNQIFKSGSARVADLAVQYSVNEATVRRDLKYLASNYGIRLTYGGAFVDERKPSFSIWEHPHEMKKRENYEAKQIIAQKAAQLISDGETIALNAGTTVELILEHLDHISRLNLITACVNIALKAARNPSITVYIPGGKIRNSSGVVYGPDTESFISRFSVDKCFLGIAAIDIKRGVTHPVLEEVAINRSLLRVSEKKFLVADTSKFDCLSLVKLADIEEFDAMIVDSDFSPVYRNYANANNVAII